LHSEGATVGGSPRVQPELLLLQGGLLCGTGSAGGLRKDRPPDDRSRLHMRDQSSWNDDARRNGLIQRRIAAACAHGGKRTALQTLAAGSDGVVDFPVVDVLQAFEVFVFLLLHF
jgi:hypothetical protein